MASGELSHSQTFSKFPEQYGNVCVSDGQLMLGTALSLMSTDIKGGFEFPESAHSVLLLCGKKKKLYSGDYKKKIMWNPSYISSSVE